MKPSRLFVYVALLVDAALTGCQPRDLDSERLFESGDLMTAHQLKSVTFEATTFSGQVLFEYQYDSTKQQRQIDRALGFSRITVSNKDKLVTFYDTSFAINERYGFTIYYLLDRSNNVVSFTRGLYKQTHTYDTNEYLSTIQLAEGNSQPKLWKSFTVTNGNITQVKVYPSIYSNQELVVDFEYDEQRINPFKWLYYGTDKYISDEQDFNMMLMAPYPDLRLGRSSEHLPVRKRVSSGSGSQYRSEAIYEYAYYSNRQGQLIKVEEVVKHRRFSQDFGKTWYPSDNYSDKNTVRYTYQ